MKRCFCLILSITALGWLFIFQGCEDRNQSDYSSEIINKKIEQQWEYYNDYVAQCGLKTHSEILLENERNDYPDSEFYRCIQFVMFDVVNKETNHSWCGVYSYDLWISQDGTGRMIFRHFIMKKVYEYTLKQEESFTLTADELVNFKKAIEENDFYNYPTWTPEKLPSTDGESTYIFGTEDKNHEHLIGAHNAQEQAGIIQIRRVIESIVSSHVTVNEGDSYGRQFID